MILESEGQSLLDIGTEIRGRNFHCKFVWLFLTRLLLLLDETAAAVPWLLAHQIIVVVIIIL